MPNRKSRSPWAFWVVALGALFWGWAESSAAAEVAGKVVAASGPVEIRPLGERAWRVATAQGVLQPGDMIRTGPGGTAEVALVDGVFRMDENTVIVLPPPQAVPAAAGAPQGVRAFLYGGRALFKVFKERLEQGFEVLTPSVIVGVKGTTFGVEHGPNLGVVVFDGTVEVAQRGRPDLPSVTLGAGQFTELFRGQLTAPQPYVPSGPGPVWNSAPVTIQSGPLPLPTSPGPVASPSGAAAYAPSMTTALGPTPSSIGGDAEASALQSALLPTAPDRDGGHGRHGGRGRDVPSGASNGHGHPAHPHGGSPGLAAGGGLSGLAGGGLPGLGTGGLPGLAGGGPPGLAGGGPAGLGAGGAPGLAGGGSSGLPPGLGPLGLGPPGQLEKK